MTLTNSTLSGNSASTQGGGIWNGDVATVISSTVSGNSAGTQGGGIFNSTVDGDALATTIITDSTVSANSAGEGGGIENTGGGALTMRNCTVSANSASGAGGGLFNDSAATLTYTIVANSLSGGNCSEPASVASLGHNLSSDGSCAFLGSGDINNTDPKLGPLANNGGPTKTHALLSGSPAIDAGGSDCPPPFTDQRGVLRPQDGDGNGSAICDIGAFELEAP